jgi:hypothetical protein
MGRGRAKAKQTKVARQLKYGTGGTDLAQLEAELAADRGATPPSADTGEDEDEDYLDEDEPADHATGG